MLIVVLILLTRDCKLNHHEICKYLDQNRHHSIASLENA